MTFSSEIENFKRATHQTLIFVGILKVKIENFKRKLGIFKRDSKFQAKTWNFQAFKRD